MTASGNGRGRKPKPGRITFVGSGPGDPGLLTTRARTVLANATCVFTDPDVPAAVLNVVGSALGPAVGPAPAPSGGADGADPTEQTVAAGPDIRPALGEPAEVAKILLAEARSGADVVRLVAGDDEVARCRLCIPPWLGTRHSLGRHLERRRGRFASAAPP